MGRNRPAQLGWAALLIVLTTAAYLPALRGGFIMDDDSLLWESRLIKAPDGLARFWFSADADDYWPMTNSSLWLEWRLWRGNPAGYHITNLVLHIGASLLIWAILRRLSIPGAYLAGLLFALHPVNVESIAWISQRKNALAMVFFLLSILWYLRAEKEWETRDAGREKISGGGLSYGLSLLALLLAMLSKGSVVVLPLLLLLIVWWRKGRISSRDLFRVAPLFVIAVGLGAVNVWFQTHGSGVVIREASFAQRLAGAGAATWFYLGRAFLPIELLFIYPPWQIDSGELLWWLPLAAAVVVTAVLWWQRNSVSGFVVRPMLFAWLFFGISLAPVLGFTDVGFMKYSLVADHYQHIAMIGAMALVAAAWSAWYQSRKRRVQWITSAAAAVVVAALLLLTFQQNRLYGDPIALYEATLEKNPTCWVAHNNVGLALAKAQRAPEAIKHYREALRLRPHYPEALNNWGAALNRIGKPQEAIEPLHEALRLDPNSAIAHSNLGMALELQGQLPEAVKEFELATKADPGFSIAYYNLANALDHLGRTSEAIDDYRQALQLNPDLPEAEYRLGLAFEQQGKRPEAIGHFQNAIRLKSDYAEAQQFGNCAYTDRSHFRRNRTISRSAAPEAGVR